MKLVADGIAAKVPTIEEAVRTLWLVHPVAASVNGIDIHADGTKWPLERLFDSVSSAMAAGDWYWLDGSAYCPACVECDSPAIDAADPLVQRGGAVSVCACCKTDYNS